MKTQTSTIREKSIHEKQRSFPTKLESFLLYLANTELDLIKQIPKYEQERFKLKGLIIILLFILGTIAGALLASYLYLSNIEIVASSLLSGAFTAIVFRKVSSKEYYSYNAEKANVYKFTKLTKIYFAIALAFILSTILQLRLFRHSIQENWVKEKTVQDEKAYQGYLSTAYILRNEADSLSALLEYNQKLNNNEAYKDSGNITSRKKLYRFYKDTIRNEIKDNVAKAKIYESLYNNYRTDIDSLRREAAQLGLIERIDIFFNKFITNRRTNTFIVLFIYAISIGFICFPLFPRTEYYRRIVEKIFEEESKRIEDVALVTYEKKNIKSNVSSDKPNESSWSYTKLADTLQYTDKNNIAYEYYELSLFYEQQDKFDDAVKLINKAIELDVFNPDYQFKKAGLLRKIGKETEYVATLNKATEIKSQIDYKKNASRSVILKELTVKDLHFYGSLKWTFKPGINVLLGKNGYGKSHLMRMITSTLQREEKVLFDNYTKNSTSADIKIELELEQEAYEVVNFKNSGFQDSFWKIPVLAIPDIRFTDKSKEVVNKPDSTTIDLLNYSSFHFINQVPYGDFIQNFLYSLCLTYFAQNSLNKSFDLPIFKILENTIFSLTGSEFKFIRIKQIVENAKFTIEVLSEGSTEPLPIQKASQGTLSIIAIFGLIFNYLKTIFENTPEEELQFQHALVFIDEVDAHLHPSWQQKVTNLLRETFPNIQFIITSHSPLVIAGCLEGEVAVLRKVKVNHTRESKPSLDGINKARHTNKLNNKTDPSKTAFIVESSVFEIEQIEHHLIGMTTQELYKTIFDIEEKDDMYLKFGAMLPFRSEMEAEIEILEKKDKLSDDEQERLNTLYNNVYYLDEYEIIKKHKDLLSNREHNTAKLGLEIAELKAALDSLSNNHKNKDK